MVPYKYTYNKKSNDYQDIFGEYINSFRHTNLVHYLFYNYFHNINCRLEGTASYAGQFLAPAKGFGGGAFLALWAKKGLSMHIIVFFKVYFGLL